MQKFTFIALGAWTAWLLAFIALAAAVSWMGFDLGEFHVGGFVLTLVVGGVGAFLLAVAGSVEASYRCWRKLRLGRRSPLA